MVDKNFFHWFTLSLKSRERKKIDKGLPLVLFGRVLYRSPDEEEDEGKCFDDYSMSDYQKT
jgi:hypothetical protein